MSFAQRSVVETTLITPMPHGIRFAKILNRWPYRSRDLRPSLLMMLSTGEPATFADIRRYLIPASLLGLGFWGLANILSNHMLPR